MYQQLFALHADLLKALAHPKRLEIIQLLRDQELCVTDMYSMLDLPQAVVSQQLMVLRDMEIVTTRKHGKKIYYRLSHPNIIQANDLLREVLIDKHHSTALTNQVAFSMKDLVPLVHDPVCKMRLSPKTAGFVKKYHGRTYYFCASGCKKSFIHDPEKYAR